MSDFDFHSCDETHVSDDVSDEPDIGQYCFNTIKICCKEF